MNAAFHTTTTVLPGHRIEISAPELQEGQLVQVVVIGATAQPPRRKPGPSGLEIIESYQGPPLFGSVEAIDRHVNEERDTWDR